MEYIDHLIEMEESKYEPKPKVEEEDYSGATENVDR